MKRLFLSLTLLAALLTPLLSVAQDGGLGAVAPFVNADTVGIVRVDLKKADIPSAVKSLTQSLPKELLEARERPRQARERPAAGYSSQRTSFGLSRNMAGIRLIPTLFKTRAGSRWSDNAPPRVRSARRPFAAIWAVSRRAEGSARRAVIIGPVFLFGAFAWPTRLSTSRQASQPVPHCRIIGPPLNALLMKAFAMPSSVGYNSRGMKRRGRNRDL